MLPFSYLEITLIRSSLELKSDGEIAALLERSIEDVHDKINELTRGGADKRSLQIQLLKEAQHKNITAKEARKEYLQEKKQKEEKRKKDRDNKQNSEEKWRADRNRREIRKKFTIKPVDLSAMISVKIDHKTIVFVKPGTDIEKVRQQYTRKSLLDKEN